MPPEGRGRVQRYVLDRARGLGPNDYVTAADLAVEVYGEPSRSQVRGVQRVVGLLADRGLVSAEYVVRGGRVVLAIRGG